MSSYSTFVFESYDFDAPSKQLSLHYSLDSKLRFTETYGFEFDFTEYDPTALDRAIQILFFVAGVSYFKTYVPPHITVRSGLIDASLDAFLQNTYQKGLGEFFYVNNLDPKTQINFPVNSPILNTLSIEGEGILCGLGGGKDSLLSAELLRGQPKVATWSLNHRSQLEPLVKRVGLPHFYVTRKWDKQLLDLRDDPDSYNGHIPISAIFAAVGTMVAILTGYRDIVVSNESTSSEPNLTYQGVAINHQYSKSLEFEQSYQHVLKTYFGASIRYYSLLRPFTELRIAEMFATDYFDTYKDVFSSCNRAYTHQSNQMFWCGTCAKCAFVFLAFTPFVKREKLETLYHGKNLLLDPALEQTYRHLLGIEGAKPLDCVGEIKESRAAMKLAQDIYPELKKYSFELPQDYDFRTTAQHSIPENVVSLVL